MKKKVSIILFVLIIAISIPFVSVAQTLSDSWTCSDEWVVDSSTVKEYTPDTVYKDEKLPGDGTFFKANNEVHPEISLSGKNTNYNNTLNYGSPFYQVQTTILKGEFSGEKYIACLVTVKMTPNNNSDYEGKERIQSSRVEIDSRITRRKSLGNIFVTYWKTSTPGGNIVDLGPEAQEEHYSVAQGGSVDISGNYNQQSGAGGSITGSYSYTVNRNYKELYSSCSYQVYDGKTSGGKAIYKYNKPNDQPATGYKATQSTLKYLAIYKCDKNVPGNYYDISLNVKGEFYYDRASRVDDGILAHGSSQSFSVRF